MSQACMEHAAGDADCIYIREHHHEVMKEYADLLEVLMSGLNRNTQGLT